MYTIQHIESVYKQYFWFFYSPGTITACQWRFCIPYSGWETMFKCPNIIVPVLISVIVIRHFPQGEGVSIYVNIENIYVHQCQNWRTLKNNRFAILNSATGDWQLRTRSEVGINMSAVWRLVELLSESQRSRWGRIHHTANVMFTSGKCQTFASMGSESSHKY